MSTFEKALLVFNKKKY